MRRFSVVITLALLGALTLVVSAFGAVTQPVLDAPAAGGVATSRPSFRWTLAEPEASSRLTVSATAAPDASGALPAPVIDVQIAAGTATYVPTLAQQLYAGRWYWNIVASDAAVPPATAASGVRAFTVRKQVLAPYVVVNSTTRGTSGTVRVKANVPTFKLRIRIVQGGSTCLDRTINGTRPRSKLHRSQTFRIYCYPAAALEAGTRTATTATVTAGGLTRTSVRRDVVA